MDDDEIQSQVGKNIFEFVCMVLTIIGQNYDQLLFLNHVITIRISDQLLVDNKAVYHFFTYLLKNSDIKFQESYVQKNEYGSMCFIKFKSEEERNNAFRGIENLEMISPSIIRSATSVYVCA